MKFPENIELCNVLHRLGSTANHTGFFYIISSVSLAVETPERLLLITKWLYPDVAKLYHTTGMAVERGICYEIARLWLKDPDRFQSVLEIPMNRRPTSSEFISILTAYCSAGRAA